MGSCHHSTVLTYAELVFPDKGDVLYLVHDPDGKPKNQKIQLVNLKEDVGARVIRTSTQMVDTATWTDISFDTESWDTDSLHDPSSNPERLTAPYDGKYLVSGAIQWPANATGGRYIELRVNGTSVARDAYEPEAAVTVSRNLRTVWEFSANDYVTMTVYQDSGGGLTVAASQVFLAMQKVG